MSDISSHILTTSPHTTTLSNMVHPSYLSYSLYLVILPEIIDLIVKCLAAANDLHTLRQLMYVNPAFNKVCIKYIRVVARKELTGQIYSKAVDGVPRCMSDCPKRCSALVADCFDILADTRKMIDNYVVIHSPSVHIYMITSFLVCSEYSYSHECVTFIIGRKHVILNHTTPKSGSSVTPTLYTIGRCTLDLGAFKDMITHIFPELLARVNWPSAII